MSHLDDAADDPIDLDLRLVNDILRDALKVVSELDGTSVDDSTVGGKKAAALLNRQLLNLADQLFLAGSLVRNDYWHGKGLLSYEL